METEIEKILSDLSELVANDLDSIRNNLTIMTTDVTRAKMFVALNYANGVSSQEERNLAFACYLQGLMAKEQEKSQFDWRDEDDCADLSGGEVILLRIPSKGGYHYDIGRYVASAFQPHISHSLHAFHPQQIEWSKIPGEGWLPFDKVKEELPVQTEVLVRWMGDVKLEYTVGFHYMHGIVDCYYGKNAEVLIIE